jgi:hypothetical protein
MKGLAKCQLNLKGVAVIGKSAGFTWSAVILWNHATDYQLNFQFVHVAAAVSSQRAVILGLNLLACLKASTLRRRVAFVILLARSANRTCFLLNLKQG